MKQKIKIYSITQKENDWVKYGKMLKAIEGKGKSESVQEFVCKELRRLDKKLRLMPEDDQKRILSMVEGK